MGMAKEISNVVISRALRNLSPEEHKKINPKTVMGMRWVLTRKADQTAKARLVVLGFQAHNLTEVETTSPTLSKLGRNCVLAVAAAMGFIVKSGDVTSAFLQTGISLEDENLHVLAPPELSAMFGAEHGEQLVLKVREAFYGLAHAPRKWFEKCVRTMVNLQWRQLKGDKCIFTLYEDDGSGNLTLVGIAGIHVDDYLIAGNPASKLFKEMEQELYNTFRWGKWEDTSFEFAGCLVKQNPDGSIMLTQEDYVLKWIEEIPIDKTKSKKALLDASEIAQLRGALGTISWRATQTGPQFLAETSLLLSEVNVATIDTLYRVNRLVREMRREAGQGLLFPCWNKPIKELAVITYADASQHNRPDRSSTIGIITLLGPREVLQGEECQLAVLQWKSGKTPRQCLGSNGAEVQSITIGEDQNYQVRMLLAEIAGENITRSNLSEVVQQVPGALVMDSRGIYDAMTRNLSSLHGLRESRGGYELVLAVNSALRAATLLRWVNGLSQLGDGLTKSGARKMLLQFFSQRQFWRLVDDPKFEAGRKVHKRELERKIKEMQALFVQKVKELAAKENLPWDEGPMVTYDHLT